MAKNVAKKQQHIFHCAVCAMGFVDFYDGTTSQASGCATFVKNRRATAGYGSRHDGTVFHFAPDLAGVQGELCDECIDQLLSAGLALGVSDGHFFGDEPAASGSPEGADWQALRQPGRAQSALASLARRPGASSSSAP